MYHKIPDRSCLLHVLLSWWWGGKVEIDHKVDIDHKQAKHRCICVNICISIGLSGRCGFHNLQLCVLTEISMEKIAEMQLNQTLKLPRTWWTAQQVQSIQSKQTKCLIFKDFKTLTRLITPTSTVFLPITDFTWMQTPTIYWTLDVPISTGPICAVHLCTEGRMWHVMTHTY